MHYFKRPSDAEKGMPEDFLTKLKNAMRWYNSSKLHNISQDTRSIFRIYRAHSNINIINELILLTLFELQELFEKLNFEKVSEI
ncbi:MAG TPA: hypothetical protein PLJ38_08935, partial [bacterium]|nr:hypothetical protein [bacterium]